MSIQDEVLKELGDQVSGTGADIDLGTVENFKRRLVIMCPQCWRTVAANEGAHCHCGWWQSKADNKIIKAVIEFRRMVGLQLGALMSNAMMRTLWTKIQNVLDAEEEYSKHGSVVADIRDDGYILIKFEKPIEVYRETIR